MTIYYHGTSLFKALQIAAFESLLSPYDQCLQDIKSNPKLQLQAGIDQLTLEELAFVRIKDHYSPNEILHRVFRVSLTTDLDNALNFAFKHPSKTEFPSYGGVVLGIDLVQNADWIIGLNNIFYSPSFKITKENLKEIYSTPLANLYLPILRKGLVLNKYSPTYHNIPPQL